MNFLSEIINNLFLNSIDSLYRNLLDNIKFLVTFLFPYFYFQNYKDIYLKSLKKLFIFFHLKP